MFRVYSLGFRVWGLGFSVYGSGSRVWGYAVGEGAELVVVEAERGERRKFQDRPRNLETPRARVRTCQGLGR